MSYRKNLLRMRFSAFSFLLLLSVSALTACSSRTSQNTEGDKTKACPKGKLIDGVCTVIIEKKSTTCGNGQTCDTSKNEVCYQEECTPIDVVKRRLKCGTEGHRGQFSETKLACVNAPNGDCQGDEQCLEGFFCDLKRQCVPNKCVAGSCERGICQGEKVGCVNKPTCDKDNECTDGYRCVVLPGVPHGLCRAIGDECSPQCEGNRECAVDPVSKEPSCIEPAECQTTRDCNEGSQCRDKHCVAKSSVTCEPDKYDQATPNNNSSSNAVDYVEKLKRGELDDLTICGGDIDWFDLSTNGASAGDTLVVTLTLPPEEIGLKPIKAAIYSDDGTTVVVPEVVHEGRDANDLQLVIKYLLPTGFKSLYKLKVYSDDSNSDTLHYTLDYSVANSDILTSCSDTSISPLPIYKTVTGDIRASGYSGLKACNDTHGTKSEQIWKLDVEEDSYVEVFVRPQDESDFAIDLRRRCEVARSSLLSPGLLRCKDSGGMGVSEKLGAKLKAGTYYVVVTSGSLVRGSGTYTIRATTRPIICDSSNNKCENVGGEVIARRCNDEGTEIVDTRCYDGCHPLLPICAGSEGDSCETPYLIGDGSGKTLHKRFRTSKFQNNLNPAEGCFSSFPQVTSGRDVVIKVHLDPNEVLIAKGRTTGKTAIYIKDSCANPDKCLDVTNTIVNGDSAKLIYENGSEARDLFVVYDYELDSSLPAEFNPTYIDVDIEVKPKICNYGEANCFGEVEVHRCDTTGTAWEVEECPLGCVAGSNQCTRHDTDECSSAPELTLTAGTDYHGSFYGLSYEVATASKCEESGTLDYSRKLRKAAFHKFTAKRGFNYQFKISSATHTPGVYMMIYNECIGHEPNGSCLVGKNQSYSASPSYAKSLNFKADRSGEYFLVVQPDTRDLDQEYTITMTETKGEIPYQKGVCDTSVTPNTYTYYNKDGIPTKIECDSCEYENCQNKVHANQGDTCGDAIFLYNGNLATPPSNKGNDVTGQFGKNNTKFLPKMRGIVDQCVFPNDLGYPEKYDIIYRFDLKADQTLKIDFNATGYYVSAFLKEDCFDINQCIGNVNKIGRGSRVISYTNQFSSVKSIYFVVKSTTTYPSSYSDYSFDWEVIDNSSYLCSPGMTYCEAGKVTSCNDDGMSKVELAECMNGCGDGPYCRVEASHGLGDSCSDAIEVNSAAQPQKGGRYIVSADDYTHVGDMECADKPGKDIYFKVNLTTAQTLYVSAKPVGYQTIALAIADKCDATSRDCLAERSAVSGSKENAETLRFKPPVDGDYYIKVTRFESNNLPFDVTFDIRDDVCSSQLSSIVCETGRLKYCELGENAYFNCGTSGCVDGEHTCTKPTGETCFDAKPLPTAKRTFSLFSKPGKSPIPIDDQISGGCHVTAPLTGAPEYFKVQLNKGDLLEAELSSGASSIYMYLTKGCLESQTECLTGRWKTAGNMGHARSRTLRYRATADGTYYLVVQATSNYSIGAAYTLQSQIYANGTPDASCVPHQGYCKDANTLTMCTSSGEDVDVACNCENGFCVTPKDNMEQCKDASRMIEATNGYSTILPFKELASDIYLPNDACTLQDTAGPDAFFKVTIPPYGTLRAYTIGKYTFDSTLEPEVLSFYLLDSCDRLAIDACVYGKAYNADTESYVGPFTYTNPTNQPKEYILGVDEKSNNRKNISSIFFYLEIDAKECDPNEVKCSANGRDLLMCDPSSYRWHAYTCHAPLAGDACVLKSGVGECVEPEGEICQDPVAVNFTVNPSDSSLFEASVTTTFGASNDYSLSASTSCSGLKTPGNDRFFKVELPAGKKLKVTASAPSAPVSLNVGLYLTDRCAFGEPSSCLVGADNTADNKANEETLEYENKTSSTKTLYLVLDSYDSMASGDVELNFSYTNP